jgi:primase-polymerase (primpol)-like protein
MEHSHTNSKGAAFVLPTPLMPLSQLRQWVIWRWEDTKTGERTKPPYQARYPQRKAESDDPSTWATYEEAVAAVAAGYGDGIGFVLTNTDVTAFDIDDCRDAQTGELHPWATSLMARAGSYTEITPSDTGLRIIGRGDGPKPKFTKLEVTDGVACEFYRKATRYITISGNSIWDVPIANIDKVFDATYNELVAQRGERDSGGHREIDLDDVIKNGRYELFLNDKSKPDKSRAVWWVINASLKQGWDEDKIVAALLNRENKISEHGYEHHARNPERYARDQINKQGSS